MHFRMVTRIYVGLILSLHKKKYIRTDFQAYLRFITNQKKKKNFIKTPYFIIL